MIAFPWGRAALGLAGVTLFLVAFAYDQQSRGAWKAVAKIEAKTHAAVSQGARARVLSQSGRGGVRDPNTTPDEE